MPTRRLLWVGVSVFQCPRRRAVSHTPQLACFCILPYPELAGRGLQRGPRSKSTSPRWEVRPAGARRLRGGGGGRVSPLLADPVVACSAAPGPQPLPEHSTRATPSRPCGSPQPPGFRPTVVGADVIHAGRTKRARGWLNAALRMQPLTVVTPALPPARGGAHGALVCTLRLS